MLRFTYDVWEPFFKSNTRRWLAARFVGVPSTENCVEVRGFPSEEAAWAWVRMMSIED